MEFFTQILSLLCVCLGFYSLYKYAVYRPKGFPPGPPRLPFFGSYLFMMLTNFKYSYKSVLKFSEWYKSDIVGFYMGSFPVVVIHNAEAIRQVLRDARYDGRVPAYLVLMRHPEEKLEGVLFQEGSIWKEQRRFVLRYLRDYGFGRRFAELELFIQDQLNDMLDLIRSGPRYEHEKPFVSKDGKRVLLPYFFGHSGLNSFLHVAYNERISRSDQNDLWQLIRITIQFQRNADAYGKMISIMPWIRYVFPKWSGYNVLRESNLYMHEFFSKIIDYHLKTYDENYERNFLDVYIKEMLKAESNGILDTTFRRDQLIMNIIDFVLPSITAISFQLSFLMQHFLANPKIQKSIQTEIDEIVGRNRLPTVDDRQFMPYTEATVREILRIETLVPSNVPHKTLEDTQLMGYNIPKDTIIIPSLYAYHNDAKVWGDPLVFRPERFLNEKGELCLKKDVSLPFGAGPPRIPLFGSYLFMMLSDFKFLHKGVLKFCKWYKSDIVGFHMGPFPVVAVHNADGVREVLTRSEFDGRPGIYVAQMRGPNDELLGIFFREGQFWKEQRRFVLRYLRDFGFGRRFMELELVIQEELNDMLDLIRNGPKFDHEKPYCKESGMRIYLPNFFSPFVANSVFHIVCNERTPRSEQADLWELIRYGLQFQRTADDYGKMLSIMPWIKHIFPNWSSYNKLTESNIFLFKYFEKIVDRHIKTYDESYERNFLDKYIREMREADLEGNEDTSFKRNQFILSLIDFTFPAFTAVGVQLSFLVQYFLLYPEVQKRIQKEIDEVVGAGRLPTLEDRQFMSYTEATIREILRIETLVPSSVPHKTLVDTELMGYKIPKDTLIVPALYAYHNDKRVWGDPQNFRPERFLDDKGHLCLKKDVSFPFGAGKRLCAGETFARNMLFLVTAALCQNFNFILADGDVLPDLSTNLSGLITSPMDYWVQLEERA
uniref:Cytochrome P450 n=1 Tax=Glossina palpalis gambiensis TaxID=67801 RepID=A0A1B0BLX1_9MUSC